MRNLGCYCYSLSSENELTGTPKLSLFRYSRARIMWRLSNEAINKRFRNLKYVIARKLCLTRPASIISCGVHARGAEGKYFIVRG